MTMQVPLRTVAFAGVALASVVASAKTGRVVLVGDPHDTEAAARLLQDAGVQVDDRHTETLATDCANQPVKLTLSAPPPEAPVPTTKFAGDERVLFVFSSDGTSPGAGWCRMKIAAAQPMKVGGFFFLAPAGEWPELISLEQVKPLRAMVFARGLRSVALMLEIGGELGSQLRAFARRRPPRRDASTR